MTAKKIGLDKVYLLALFAAGLGVAALMIRNGHKARLTEPVALGIMGFEAPLPAGESWDGSGRWTFSQGSFVLESQLIMNRRAAAMVKWRYLLSPVNADAQQLLMLKARSYNAVAVANGRCQKGQLTIDWLRAESDSGWFGGEIFMFGLANLPNGHTVMLEVAQFGGMSEMFDVLFESLFEKAVIKTSEPLEAGRKFVNELKEKGFGHLPKSLMSMMVGGSGRTAGFTVSGYSISDEPNQALKSAGVYFISIGGRKLSEQSAFKANKSFDDFQWSVVSPGAFSQAAAGRSLLLKDGIVSVHSGSAGNLIDTFAVPENALPEPLLDAAVCEFAAGSQKTVMIEMINSDYGLVPAILSRGEISGELAKRINPAYAVQIDMLHNTGSTQVIYLNSAFEAIRIEVQTTPAVVLEHFDLSEIINNYPQWQSVIEAIVAAVKNKN